SSAWRSRSSLAARSAAWRSCADGARVLVAAAFAGAAGVLAARAAGAFAFAVAAAAAGALSAGDGFATATGGAAGWASDVLNAGAGIGTSFFIESGGKYGSTSFGRFGVTPGELLARISGVIITTSSVWFLCAALLLNSRPRIGMSPMPGIFCIVEFIVLFIKPAMA